MTGISQQFCVRWNSHLGSLGAAFPQLLAGQQFVDVTLACDGHQVHCHRLVLAACSSYFESLLSENPCKHPIIILPKDIKLWEIHALVDFMYKGQVNVSQAGLPQLLKCAETLQIRGLCGTESSLNEVANGKIERDSNHMANTCSPNFNFTSMFASNLLNPNYQSDDEPQQQQQPSQQPSLPPFRQQHSDLQRSAFADTTKSTTNHRSNENLVKTKAHKNAHTTDKTTKDHCNATPNTTKTTLKRLSEHETASNTGSNSELNIKCEEIDSDPAADDGMDDDLDEHSNSKQSEYTMQQNDVIVVDNDLLVVCDGSKDTAHNGSDSNAQIDTEIFPTTTTTTTNDDDNDDANSISITKNDSVDDVNMCYSPSWSIPGDDATDDCQSVTANTSIANHHEFECDLTELPTSLKFNRNTMSIFVKRTATATKTIVDQQLAQQQNQTDFGGDDSENIVCSPNFGAIRHRDFNETTTNGTANQHNNDHHFQQFNANHTMDDGYTNQIYHTTTDDMDELRTMRTRANKRSDRLMELLKYKDPLRSAVVLRSPRGNQPRSYTTDALYAALMDVKSGESIYRASQIHGVPRKTLRNWMKRWHIKSVYPMPYQLKKAAEKKRQTGQQNETQTNATASTQAELSPEIVDTNDY